MNSTTVVGPLSSNNVQPVYTQDQMLEMARQIGAQISQQVAEQIKKVQQVASRQVALMSEVLKKVQEENRSLKQTVAQLRQEKIERLKKKIAETEQLAWREDLGKVVSGIGGALLGGLVGGPVVAAGGGAMGLSLNVSVEYRARIKKLKDELAVLEANIQDPVVVEIVANTTVS